MSEQSSQKHLEVKDFAGVILDEEGFIQEQFKDEAHCRLTKYLE